MMDGSDVVQDDALDPGIRISIAPTHSAYFAGEPFSVQITFTNTRTPVASSSSGPYTSASALNGPSPSHLSPNPSSYKPTHGVSRSISGPSSSDKRHAHRRGAHSISSAPLAKPPTSPGLPSHTLHTPKLSSHRKRDNGDGSPALTRKGLIGSLDDDPEADAQDSESRDEGVYIRPSSRSSRRTGRSLSVDISARSLMPALSNSNEEISPHSPLVVQRALGFLPSSPKVSSPLARSAFPISAHHPHARKSSVALSPYTPGSPQAGITSPNSSPGESMPASPVPPSPAFNHPTGMDSEPGTPTYAAAPTPTLMPAPPRRTSSSLTATTATLTSSPMLQPPPPRSTSPLPPSPSASPVANGPSATAPGTEIILYAYAQLSGTLILPTLFSYGAPLAHLRRTLRAAQAVGGGRMDLAFSLSMAGGPMPPASPISTMHSAPARTRGHARGGSIFSSILGSAPDEPVQRPGTGRMRSASTISFSKSASSMDMYGSPPATAVPSGIGLGLGLGSGGNGMGMSTPNLGVYPTPASGVAGRVGPVGGGGEDGAPLPVLDVQPSMLAVDLALGPGESRTYTYTIDLPGILPPTHAGKTLSFGYELVVGACRAPAPSAASAGGHHIPAWRGANAAKSSSSRVMKVPIRVYNHVSAEMQVGPYDLLWPVERRRRGGVGGAKVVERHSHAMSGKEDAKKLAKQKEKEAERAKARDALAAYAKQLLSLDSADATANGDDEERGGGLFAPEPPPLPGSPGLESPEDLADIPVAATNTHGNGGGLSGCREAVEILTRNLRKASYDIEKDGVRVAVLTFAKSSYRLGETVLGIVEMNERGGRARVLKMSAMLEAHEQLPASVRAGKAAEKKVHAEHHAAFTGCALRTTFVLDIPSDASPSFGVDVGDTGAGAGGVEWKVRLSLLVAVASEHAVRGSGEGGARTRHLVRDELGGGWGSAYRARTGIAPLERWDREAEIKAAEAARKGKGWGAWAASFVVGSGGAEDGTWQDGDALEEGLGLEEEDLIGGPETAWKEVKVERVECEVPVRVWPGNTAFKAAEVVFDV